jgi:hypothetical protein
MRLNLEKGIEVYVDALTGVFIFHEYPMFSADISDTRFDPVFQDSELATADRTWTPLDTDPTHDGGSDLVMIERTGDRRSDVPADFPQISLPDVRSGRSHRVPFRGAKAMLGCFANDHTAAVLCGDDPLSGEPGLWLVDLKTGVNRRIGGQPLAHTLTVEPARSPDGKTVAALNYADPEQPRAARLVLIDLATDHLRTIGTPQDLLFLNWQPDGKALIIGRRNGPDTPPDVCRISLADGELTPLFKGGGPVVIPGNNPRIFYYYADGWMTRAIDGSDPKPVAPGIQRLFSLTPDPGGTRLFMIAGGDGRSGLPVWVDLATGKTDAIPVGRGGWGHASWR